MHHLLHSEADAHLIKLYDVQHMTRRLMLQLANSLNNHKVDYVSVYKSLMTTFCRRQKKEFFDFKITFMI
jgi:hypothetical protein